MTNQNWNDPAGSQPSPEPQPSADQSQPSPAAPQPFETPASSQGSGYPEAPAQPGPPTYGYTPPDYNTAPSYGPTPGYADASGYTPPTSQPSAGQPSYGYTPPASQPSAGQPSYGFPSSDPAAGQPSYGYTPPASQPSAGQPSYGAPTPDTSGAYGASTGYPSTPGYAAPTGPEGGYGYTPTTDPSAASYGAGYTTPTADYGQSQAAGYGTAGYGTTGGYDAYGQPAQPGYGQDPNAYGATGYGTQDPNAYGGYAQQSVSPYGYDSGYAASAPALSTWGRRAIGAVIDYILPAMAAGAIGGGIVGSFNDSLGSAFTSVLFMAFVIWNTVIQGGRTGLTLGRKVAKTKVVSEETGQPIGPGMALLRYFAHIVDSVICYIGWLFPLWDSKRQTIADKIVKTVVIDTDGPVAR